MVDWMGVMACWWLLLLPIFIISERGVACPVEEFECPDNAQCVPRCDGNEDCAGGADETDCGNACDGLGIDITMPGVPYYSPGYADDGSGSYTDDLTCFWNITAAEGTIIKVVFTNQTMDGGDDIIGLLDEEDLVAWDDEDRPWIGFSSSNQVSVQFRADFSNVGNGFRFYFEYLTTGPCGRAPEALIDATGYVAVDGYKSDETGRHGANANCQWTFPISTGSTLMIDFEGFETEDEYDVLAMYNDTGDEVATFSGPLGAFTLGPFRKPITFSFTSDDSYQFNGFAFTYSIVAPIGDNDCGDGDGGDQSNASIVSCDCHVRYLKHTDLVNPSASPCLGPPSMVGRRWDDIDEDELACTSAESSPSNKIRSATSELHRHSWCAWPAVSSVVTVGSVMECAVLCMQDAECLYINVKPQQFATAVSFMCALTSFTAQQPAVVIIDPDAWTSYLVAP